MTLEEYFRYELAQGKIDFTLRASTFAGGPVECYIRPTGRDGTTTPSLMVEGNTVRLRPGCYSPEWPE